jgi:hypothetical protein
MLLVVSLAISLRELRISVGALEDEERQVHK